LRSKTNFAVVSSSASQVSQHWLVLEYGIPMIYPRQVSELRCIMVHNQRIYSTTVAVELLLIDYCCCTGDCLSINTFFPLSSAFPVLPSDYRPSNTSSRLHNFSLTNSSCHHICPALIHIQQTLPPSLRFIITRPDEVIASPSRPSHGRTLSRDTLAHK
jgi:hypothetical protein